MKAYTILFVFFAVLFSSEAKAALLDATVIDLEGKSIKCQIKANMMWFSDEINPLFVTRRLRGILPDGSKVKFRLNEVTQLTLHSTPSGVRVFESHQVKKKRILLEVISKGPIGVYLQHYPHGYDGSPMERYAVMAPEGIKMISSIGWRKRLTNIFPSSAYFARELEERNFKYHMFPEFMAKYEATTK
jgi:hypothetical protein